MDVQLSFRDVSHQLLKASLYLRLVLLRFFLRRKWLFLCILPQQVPADIVERRELRRELKLGVWPTLVLTVIHDQPQGPLQLADEPGSDLCGLHTDIVSVSTCTFGQLEKGR